MLKREEIFNYDLVITTYDTATNDVEFFRKHNFNYIILDESQAIKNPNSKRYKAMRLLRSTNRVVMTGTPIENNTFDLYAQFSFLNPGIFGSQQNFRNHFALPIDKNNDQDAAMMLRKIINPFYSDVLKNKWQKTFLNVLKMLFTVKWGRPREIIMKL